MKYPRKTPRNLHASETPPDGLPASIEPAMPIKETSSKGPPSLTVTFTGDPRGGADPKNPEYGGKSFPKGEAVVIDDAGWIKIYGASLRKNNHFMVE